MAISRRRLWLGACYRALHWPQAGLRDLGSALPEGSGKDRLQILRNLKHGESVNLGVVPGGPWFFGLSVLSLNICFDECITYSKTRCGGLYTAFRKDIQ